MFFFNHSYITIIIAVIAIWAMPVYSVINMSVVKNECADLISFFGDYQDPTNVSPNQVGVYINTIGNKFQDPEAINRLRNSLQTMANNTNQTIDTSNVMKLQGVIITLMAKYENAYHSTTQNVIDFCKLNFFARNCETWVTLINMLNQ